MELPATTNHPGYPTVLFTIKTDFRRIKLHHLVTHLITSSTSWLELLSIMPATVDIAFLEEVDQVYQKVIAHAADKAARMPALVFPCT